MKHIYSLITFIKSFLIFLAFSLSFSLYAQKEVKGDQKAQDNLIGIYVDNLSLEDCKKIDILFACLLEDNFINAWQIVGQGSGKFEYTLYQSHCFEPSGIKAPWLRWTLNYDIIWSKQRNKNCPVNKEKNLSIDQVYLHCWKAEIKKQIICL